jgi:hypothetical protein
MIDRSKLRTSQGVRRRNLNITDKICTISNLGLGESDNKKIPKLKSALQLN